MTAKQVKNLRSKLGETQEEFAQRLRVPLISLQAWEQGINKPSAAAVSLLKGVKKGTKS